MPVDQTHPQCEAIRPQWSRARDFLAGEVTVRNRRELYLPKLSGQNTEEYDAYLQRGEFLNATNRTHQALLGLVFMKDPAWNIPKEIDVMVGDCDTAGSGIYGYAKNIVSEVLAIGRAGTLIDWSEEENRPYFAAYSGEAILNWKHSRMNGRTFLSMVVLMEMVETPGHELDLNDKMHEHDEFGSHMKKQIRVLRLIPGPDMSMIYTVEIWRQQTDGKTVKWVLEEEAVPVRNGRTLGEIPFVFHSADRTMDVCRPPLDDLISLNLTHYRLSADHYHGLHYTALPTPWVAGFDANTELRIGSGVAWVSENPEASAGFLEFSGTGLGAIREELDRLEKSMAVMGARLLETQKREAETAESMQIRQGGETAVLTGITGAISDSISDALRWAHWWSAVAIDSRTDIEEAKTSVELNTDFGTARMSSDEVTALVTAWIQRGISRKTLFENLQKGEIIPPDRTFEDEIEMIDAEPPGPGMELDEDEPKDKPAPAE